MHGADGNLVELALGGEEFRMLRRAGVGGGAGGQRRPWSSQGRCSALPAALWPHRSWIIRSNQAAAGQWAASDG
jgi:hypothetical protein